MRPLPYFSLAALATAALVAGVPAYASWGTGNADIPMNGNQPEISYGERVAANDLYDAYYDGALGLYTDGYWGTDGSYWLLSQDGRVWSRDGNGHFRHTPADGFVLVRGTGVQREN